MPARNIFDFNGTAFPAALAFSSAYLEVTGFIAFFGLFTSVVTGNIILIGVELVKDSPQTFVKTAVIPVFIVSFALWGWLLSHAPKPSAAVIRIALGTQAVLLIGAIVLQRIAAPLDGANGYDTIGVAALVVMASTLQLMTLRHQISTHPHTTMMTGNIAAVAIDAANLYYARLYGKSSAATTTPHKHKTIGHHTAIIACFLAGAVSGGLAYDAVGFLCLVLPVALAMLFAAGGWISGAA